MSIEPDVVTPKRQGLTANRLVGMVLTAATLACIMAFGLGLRLYQIENETAYFDETVTLWELGAPNLATFLSKVRERDPTFSPLFFSTAYAWSRVAGESVIAMRLLPLCLGMFSLLILFLLGRTLYGTGAGLVAAFLMAASLKFVFYSQEIRMYALTVPLALLSVYSLWSALHGRRAMGWWALHVAANAALAFTHLFSVLFFAMLAAFLLLTRWRQWRLLGSWAAAQIAICVAVAASLDSEELARMDNVTAWIPRSTPGQIALSFVDFAIGRVSDNALVAPSTMPHDRLLALVPLLFVAAFVVGELSRRRGKMDERLLLLMLWLFVPTVALHAASIVVRPFFVDRYVLSCAIPLYVLVAAAAVRPRGRWVRMGAVCVLVATYTYMAGAVRIEAFRNLHWDKVGDFIARRIEPEDALILVPQFDWGVLEFYQPKLMSRVKVVDHAEEIREAVLSAKLEGRNSWVLLPVDYSDVQTLKRFFAADRLRVDGYAFCPVNPLIEPGLIDVSWCSCAIRAYHVQADE